MDSFSPTTLAKPGRLGLCVGFPESFEASNLRSPSPPRKHYRIQKNLEIYNEIDTTTLKYQIEIHTSAFGSLTAAMEEDTNQTSQQSRKMADFSYMKIVPGRAKHFG